MRFSMKAAAIAAGLLGALVTAGCAGGYDDYDHGYYHDRDGGQYWHRDRHSYRDRNSYRDHDRRWVCDADGDDCHWEHRD